MSAIKVWDLPIALRKGVRGCTQKPRYPLSHFVSYDKLSSNHQSFLGRLNTAIVPKTMDEAWNSKNWKNAMKVEMVALEKNKTWKLVDLPEGKNLVGCRRVFTIKSKADGRLERYKARLVGKSTQTYGVDYHETILLVAKMNSVRIYCLKQLIMNNDK